MSARLFKNGLQTATAFAPLSIRKRNDSPGESPAAGTATEALEQTSADQRAQHIVAAAQAEAEQLLATAQAQAEQIEREAYEKGLIEARAGINDEVNAGVEELRQQLAHTLSELEQLYSLIAARTERDLVRLALEVARKVVHREVSTDPDIVLTLVRVALDRLHPRAVATVLLHPDDYEYVNHNRHSLSNSSAIEIVADMAVRRGGCLVKSDHGDMDARIEQQFATIERGFFEA